jgi:hypothetical protein
MSEEPDKPRIKIVWPSRDWVALILAVGISSALLVLVFAAAWSALFSEQKGLSENYTQIMIATFGGLIGVLGSYIGFQAGANQQRKADENKENDRQKDGPGD